MTKTIEIIVAPDGSLRLQTRGFEGSACKLASEFLERALGAKQTEQLTADYYTTPTAAEAVREGQA